MTFSLMASSGGGYCWVDLGCEPTDGEAVLSDFYRPGLNIVADQSVKWTVSFSGGLMHLRSYLLRSSSQPSGKSSVHPHIPAQLHMREAQIHPLG